MAKRKAAELSRASSYEAREKSRTKRYKALEDSSSADSSGDELVCLSDHEVAVETDEFVPSTTSESSDIDMELTELLLSDTENNLIRISEDLSEPPESEMISAWTAPTSEPLRVAEPEPEPEVVSAQPQDPTPQRPRSARIQERAKAPPIRRIRFSEEIFQRPRTITRAESKLAAAKRDLATAQRTHAAAQDWLTGLFTDAVQDAAQIASAQADVVYTNQAVAEKQAVVATATALLAASKVPLASIPIRRSARLEQKPTPQREEMEFSDDGSEYEPDPFHNDVWDGRALLNATEWVILRETEIHRRRGGKTLYGVLEPGVVVKVVHVGRTWIAFEVKNKRSNAIRGGHAKIHGTGPNGERLLNICPRSEAHLHQRKTKAEIIYIQDGHSAEPQILVNEGFPELNRFGLNANRPALKEYQQEGIRWMTERERFDRKNPDKVLGGILADEMGLGKTVQTITTMIRNPFGPTLIVVPVSILQQWKDEIDSWSGGRFYVHLYHGPLESHSRSITWEDDLDPQYGIMRRGFEYWGTMYDRAFYARTTLRCMQQALPGQEIPDIVANIVGQYAGVNTGVMLTTYGVLHQEVKSSGVNSPLFHLIKENRTERVAWHRVIGDEMHKIRNHNTDLSRIFAPQETGWLKGAKVRRWVLSGTPLQNNPEEIYAYLRFLQWKHPEYRNMPDVRSFCNDLHIRAASKREGKSLGAYAINRIKNILYPPTGEPLMLRRTKKNLEMELDMVEIDEKIVIIELTPEEQEFYNQCEKKVALDVKKRLDEKKHHRVSLCTYWTTLVNTRQAAVHPRPTYRRISKIVKSQCALPDCDAPLVDERKRPYNPTMAIDFPKVCNRYGKPVGVRCKMVSNCQEIHRMPEKKTCWVCTPADKDVFTTTCCFSTMCKDHIPMFNGRTDKTFNCPICDELITKDEFPGWFPGFDHEPIPEDFKNWFASSKINVTIDTVETILAENPDEKVVIFSQWTEVLDLLGEGCQARGIDPLRLDGSTSRKQRVKHLRNFREDADKRVFLASLGSSGEGLNLTTGSHVILVDPWWNPATEKQAVARLHRIGQKRKVTIYRLLASGSIEERLLRIQAFKNRMVSVLLERGHHEEDVQEYSQDEILYLLGVDEFQNQPRWRNEPLGLVDTAEKSTVHVSMHKTQQLRNRHAGEGASASPTTVSLPTSNQRFRLAPIIEFVDPVVTPSCESSGENLEWGSESE